MDFFSQNILWEALLELRSKVTSQNKPSAAYSMIFTGSKFQVKEGIESGSTGSKSIVVSRKKELPEMKGAIVFYLDNKNTITLSGKIVPDNGPTRFLLHYLPFCFYSEVARKQQRTFTILHLSQTLDGRIATLSGHSRWVSSREDLIHTHRMRALCDAVLIGANTLKRDSPQLTVRHVTGPNPCKIVVANTQCNFDNLKKSKGKVIVFTSTPGEVVEGVETIPVSNQTGQCFSTIIQKELFNRNIYTLFIEGGAKTASLFLEEKTVDKIQLYISPQIFGSGINTFTLPAIEKVADSVRLLHTSFKPMGNGVLFEGELRKHRKKTRDS